MKFFLDTEFHEYKKDSRILGIRTSSIDTIELISVGIITENGESFYEICNEFDVESAWSNDWLRDNVIHKIFLDLLVMETELNLIQTNTDEFNIHNLSYLLREHGSTKSSIACGIKEFVYKNSQIDNPELNENWEKIKHQFPVEFYGYYADYDWVVICWIFGRMIDMPKGFPFYCKDLKQMLDEANVGDDWLQDNCPQSEDEHNALADAKWNLLLYNALINKSN
jgi:hypothetical protein